MANAINHKGGSPFIIVDALFASTNDKAIRKITDKYYSREIIDALVFLLLTTRTKIRGV